MHQGRAKGVGVDCAGVVIESAKVFGYHELVNFKDDVSYGRTPDSSRIIAELRRTMDAVPWDNRKPADVLSFNVEGDLQHVGLLLPGNYLLHALETTKGYGKVVKHRLSTDWTNLIVGVYAFKTIGNDL